MRHGGKLGLWMRKRVLTLPDNNKITALGTNPPEPGTMQKLADDLYWIRFTLPFRLDHINLFALDTDVGWLLLDCGIKGEATATQWQDLLEGPLAGRPVIGIIVSHYHADHIGYASALASRTGAQVFMGAIEHEQAQWGLSQTDAEFAKLMMATYRRYGLADMHINAVYKAGNYYRSLVDNLPKVTIVRDDHHFISKTGCWQVRFDSGHSPGHMSLTDNDRKLHICVDFLLPRISPNVSVKLRDLNYDMLADYLNYLESMTNCPPEQLIIPGHDWPYYGGATRAKQLINHHAARLEQLLDIIVDKPINTNDAMNALFPFDMTGHEIFFASCEARAHLNHLVTTRHIAHVSGNSEVDLFAKC